VFVIKAAAASGPSIMGFPMVLALGKVNCFGNGRKSQ